MNSIGEVIKTERKKIGLTQQEFAAHSGLGYRFVKELEQGKQTVRMDKVQQALDFLGLTIIPQYVDYSQTHENTPVAVIIRQVAEICKKHGVKHLYLFGSYAKGTQTRYSDLDFAIKGFSGDYFELKDELDNIRTLKTIDLVEYDKIASDLFKKEIDTYGRKIY